MLQRLGRNCSGRLENRHTRHNNALQARQVVRSASYACRHDAFETHNRNPFLPSKATGAHSIHRRNMRSMSQVKSGSRAYADLPPRHTTHSSSAVLRNPRRHNWSVASKECIYTKTFVQSSTQPETNFVEIVSIANK
jgi:hypothetical protein